MTKENNKNFLNSVKKTVGKAVNRYGLIGAEDRILVGLSGGKDSYVLLETLALRLNHIPVRYELHGAHVRMENVGYEIDRRYLRDFCGGLNVTLHEIDLSFRIDPDSRESPCFECSRRRRRALFEKARELGCRKLALGHNRDDVIETLLMNMIYQASISSIPPLLSLFKGNLEIIRPLYLVSEEELRRYSDIQSFPHELKRCPYGESTRRDDIKKIIEGMEKINDKARSNLFHSMINIHDDYLPDRSGEKEDY